MKLMASRKRHMRVKTNTDRQMDCLIMYDLYRRTQWVPEVNGLLATHYILLEQCFKYMC
jgi:hypothetical protein